ncbi:hypothetical protein CEXT_567971 [Caerostris extrusa]|uniref:Uncharacterized protein n=1 Tax=Caerostris extrusa TaxID=172846 RepID=A0AAV4PZR9_CAEEX|nr:hypothetical protein CEXT_567971 [Caerostris extrusa]
MHLGGKCELQQPSIFPKKAEWKAAVKKLSQGKSEKRRQFCALSSGTRALSEAMNSKPLMMKKEVVQVSGISQPCVRQKFLQGSGKYRFRWIYYICISAGSVLKKAYNKLFVIGYGPAFRTYNKKLILNLFTYCYKSE